MVTNLRRYVRFLVEAAVGGEQAANSGLALFRRTSGQFVQYILYNPTALKEVMDDPSFYSMRFKKPLGEIVLGYVQARPRSGECNNATQIVVSVATKGYGPLMYDIVMSDSEGGIMSDRNSTSDAAKNIWKHYAQSGQVEMTPFDDKDDPKTPEPDDDCYLVDDKLLDQSFDGKGQGGAKSKLLQNHEQAMDELPNDKVKRQTLESICFNSLTGTSTSAMASENRRPRGVVSSV